MTAATVATYREWLQWRGCGDKVPYSGRRVAENAATALAWKGRDGLTAYECVWCGYWHVGHAVRG